MDAPLLGRLDQDMRVLLEAGTAHRTRQRDVGARVAQLAGADDFAGRNARPAAQLGDLIGKAEGQVAVGVVHQLDQFARLERGDGDRGRRDLAEQLLAAPARVGIVGTDDLGQFVQFDQRAALERTLGAERDLIALAPIRRAASSRRCGRFRA